jgi:hypothetical protein
MAYKFNPFTGNFDDVGDPSGADTQIQFNDDGSFGASADLTWDDTGKVLDVGGDINLDDGGSFQTTLQLVTPTAARTITFPDATGTVGLVAGSTGQLVFNNAGAYSGLSGVTTDGTDITLTGRFISSLNGAASAPPGTFTGTWFTGGTATTTKPQVLIEPTGTTSTAWSTSGTGLGVNAASGFGGRLLDLQLNGTSNFNVASTGAAVGASFSVTGSTAPANGVYLQAGNTIGFATNSTLRGVFDSNGRLLVGTSTASTTLGSLTAKLQVQGTSAFDTGTATVLWAADTNPALINLVKSRGATVGTHTIVQNNDSLGRIVFGGSDGADFKAAALTQAQVDGTPGANDMPGRLVFSTTAAGASSPTERLRITSAGVLQIADAGDITVGTTTGTKIGTATTQKLGFYNATPVVQPAAVADATDAATVITQLNDLLAKLRTLGIIAT